MSPNQTRAGVRWLSAAAFAIVLAVALVVWALTHRYEAPDVPGAAAASSSSSPATATTAGAVPAPSPATSTKGSPPVSVSIPALQVTSRLLHLGLNSDGTMAVPSDAQAHEAAWFTGSPTPGTQGPAVIEAHVTAPGGAGPFFRLATMKDGDTVSVTLSSGKTVQFSVYQVSHYPKDAFPTGDVYGNTTGAELRLITCGGQFNRSTGHFEDNTVVYARQA